MISLSQGSSEVLGRYTVGKHGWSVLALGCVMADCRTALGKALEGDWEIVDALLRRLGISRGGW